MPLRIGHGIDVHRFVDQQPLWLGGVSIPHSKGLLGHSDADALIHAICDALLGALSLGDIGKFFPDTDPQYKNKESSFFLEKIMEKVSTQGWKICNVDSTVVTEEPILRPHIDKMRGKLSSLMKLEISQVSIKATRPEQMGALGQKEGLLALATVLLEQA